ncbi:hypothetical protein HMPREF1544_09221 [Mucor circinelloides 1006PhL]|uniref:C2H2-type domain-containing protein n=1 Tax=Mucor circinelloides f. circinelloides (strain 1006PhL) TaxID=1220926 RepID=S2J6V8_MUCC1|nr:hypothetical protein HMPREF1544_09221 [Mucor circinelloides 1006PhL]KAG1120351.1 hypothetical protein G6F42_012769 [Rhizopus arrhizus]
MPKEPKKTLLKARSAQDPIQKTLSIIQSDFERRYACPDCDKELSCGSSLKRHLLLKHKKEMTLKFGRAFKGGRSFSNQRYYMKKRKPKPVEKTDKQLQRSLINQRAYQKKVFQAEAETLKQAVIESTVQIIQQYNDDVEDLRKHLDVAAVELKAQHNDSMYTEIQTTLGLPDTFQIRYSIAFYLLLAIANRLPHFVNLEYNKKEVALGLCWRNLDQDDAKDRFEYNDEITSAIFEQMDCYFLGKGKAIKQQKLKYMTCIASFLNAVFTACGNKYTLIKSEAKNACYSLRSLFKQPLTSLPFSSTTSKTRSTQDDASDADGHKEASESSNPAAASSTESNNPAFNSALPPLMIVQNNEHLEPTAIPTNNVAGSASTYNTTIRFAKNVFASSWPSSNQNLNDE